MASTWTWQNVVAALAIAAAALRLVGLLLGERPVLARAARFVIVCVPFGGIWWLGSPLWLAAAFGAVVALATTAYSSAAGRGWSRFARDLTVGAGWAGTVHLFWWNWRYGIGGVGVLLLILFLAARVARGRQTGELRAIASRASWSSTGRKCVACGKEVPASSRVGETCPHCGRDWGAAVGV